MCKLGFRNPRFGIIGSVLSCNYGGIAGCYFAVALLVVILPLLLIMMILKVKFKGFLFKKLFVYLMGLRFCI